MEECVFISQLGFISEHVSWLCFTEKEHFLPVFTEKRALFQHILRDVKSTKCELKEHLWEGANGEPRIINNNFIKSKTG